MHQHDLSAFTDELCKIAAAGALRKTVARQLAGVLGGTALKSGERSMVSELGQLVLRPSKTLKSGLSHMGLGEKALLGGTAGAGLADDSDTKHNLGGRIGGVAGSTAAWLALRRSPLLGQLAGHALVSGAGTSVGNSVGKAFGG